MKTKIETAELCLPCRTKVESAIAERRKRKAGPKRDEARAMRAKGWTLKAIAKRLSIGLTTAWEYTEDVKNEHD